MKWGKILGDAAKAALIFGAVGALLALAAPTIGLLVGATEAGIAASNVAWSAGFFGAFGALNTVVTPVIKTLLGEKPEEEKRPMKVSVVLAASPQQCHEQAPSLTVNHHHNNKVKIEQDVNVLAAGSHSLLVGDDIEGKGHFTAAEDARRLERVLMESNQRVH